MNIIKKMMFDKWIAKNFGGMSSDDLYKKLKVYYGDVPQIRTTLADAGIDPEKSLTIRLAQSMAKDDMDRLYNMFRSPAFAEIMEHHMRQVKYRIINVSISYQQ